MISAGEFRNGVTFEQDGQVLQVVEFQHVKPGKGAALSAPRPRMSSPALSLRPATTPPLSSLRLSSSAKRSPTPTRMAICTTSWMLRPMTTSPVGAADVPDNFKFCKENDTCKLLSYKGKVFSVEIPNFVELEVTATEPVSRGNTATNTLKPATLETGAEIRVPLFINEGDMIRIDTRTGEYMERVN